MSYKGKGLVYDWTVLDPVMKKVQEVADKNKSEGSKTPTKILSNGVPKEYGPGHCALYY